jgi:hypothetical protein
LSSTPRVTDKGNDKNAELNKERKEVKRNEW